MGDETPGLGTFDGFLPIPCQCWRYRPSPVKVGSTTRLRGRTPKPSAVSQRLTVRIVQRPAGIRAKRGLWPPITAVGRNVARFRGIPPEPLKDAHCRVAILNVGSVNA